jgi:Tc toxin complex TcA C-terminal TcB-binding domain
VNVQPLSTSFYTLNPYSGASWSADLEAELAGYDIANDCRPAGQTCRPPVAAALFPGQYFCVPPNPKLPEYWDRVEDRLFKIRHCRNLDGEQRSLALFQPPIDPALLVRARAAGLSIEDILAGLAEAQLPYRFQYLLGKAQDFTAEVKALGGQLLSAIEKKDAEELNQIRQTHELNIQRATRNLKLMSLAEAKEGLAALNHSLKGAEITLANYEGREFTSSEEQMTATLTLASDAMITSEQASQMVASVLRLIPDVYAGAPPQVKIGGHAIGDSAAIVAQGFGMLGSIARSGAGRSSTLGNHKRRAEEWGLQIDTSRERIKELNRQIISAEIRIQTAEKDLEVFDLQIENTKEIYDYMRSKFTNEQLYGWMVGQLKTFHRSAYNLAANMARQAQMAYKRELGDGTSAGTPLDVLTANHWDSSRTGLLAGEKLSFELKKLDDAYTRTKAKLTIYELSRTVSLRRLDPVLLFKLRSGNAIQVFLPKWLFQTKHGDQELKDMRIKAVSISLPCTVGPNTRVPIQVRLVDALTPSQRKIITSTSQGDSGRFDPNPNGETYLPFENEKIADSKWEITLPELLEFDPATISDLIFNIRYTAQPETVSGASSPIQSDLESGNGRFAVSLRYDNNDGWLELQRILPKTDQTTESGIPTSQLYPIGVVDAATPYVYSNSTLNGSEYYLIFEDGTLSNVSPPPVGNTSPPPAAKLWFDASTQKITENSKIVADIIQVRTVSVPLDQ